MVLVQSKPSVSSMKNLKYMNMFVTLCSLELSLQDFDRVLASQMQCIQWV